MSRLVLLLIVCSTPAAARGGVLVLANYTAEPVTVTVAGPPAREVKLEAGAVRPVRVAGPTNVTYPTNTGPKTVRVEPYNAYVFIPDPKAGQRLEGVELPGDPPDPPPRELDVPDGPVTVKVRLLVDDADPRAEAGWRPALKKRLEEAGAVVEAHSGIRFELTGYDTWRSDATAGTLPALLTDFEAKVRVKAWQLAVGWTSRRVTVKGPEATGYGAFRGRPAQHVLLGESQPQFEAARVEVLVHHLGLAVGAVPLPDPGSVMRPKLVDGRAARKDHKVRFDPLNALAMSIWAEELTRDPPATGPDDVTPANQARLARVYRAIKAVEPADPAVLHYLNQLGPRR